EQEAKAKAEQEVKAKAELAARQKAEVGALVRAELEAKAKADRAEQELRDAVSEALAAASKEPELPSAAPSSVTHRLEEDFFASPPAPQPVDIFANLDEKPDEQELADFRKTLRAARPEAGPRSPTRAEMRALAQEFSVVTKLERHKKKHGLWIGIGVGAAAAIVAIVLLIVPSSGGPELAANDEDFETFQRRLYDAPVTPNEPERAEEPAEAVKVVDKTPSTPVKRPPVTVRKEPKVEGGEKLASGEGKKPITAAQYAALTQDELGKSEFKLDFDSSAAAKKAAEEAAAKKAQRADELSAEVASAFGKKKSQFAKCGDDLQERIRVVFTVSTTGKVSGPEVSGSQSSAKSQCIRQILERSIFPAGDTDLTYSQVLVL
ncbi:MAG TPA: hypothetical protein PK095_21385, partial [Myxococcota bacterium]|nr:hypothetical protein [Myxococcota bacterium]